MKFYTTVYVILIAGTCNIFCFNTKQDESTELLATKKYNQANTTLIVYMAADNDLRSFAARNIKQMAAIGSNQYVHIAVHLDIRITGNKKITRRYYIEQNKILHMNANDPHTQQMDSGQPDTLISACEWAIKNFPAKEYVLVFWNHATGCLDPTHGRIINPTNLFTYNPTFNMLELDRSTSILAHDAYINNAHDSSDLLFFVDKSENKDLTDWQDVAQDIIQTDDLRGVCWDDSTGNYLTNQKIDTALSIIRQKYLNNKKFSIIAFDACLMSMFEVAKLVSEHANIMVGSQEVELGTGWDYEKVLRPFLNGPLTKKEFAQHIVQVYEETYNKITHDYTQSAISLDDLSSLEDNLNKVAIALLEALNLQKDKSVLNAIRASKNKLLCTHFDEPSYIDLHHLYTNLEYNLKYFVFTDQKSGAKIVTKLRKLFNQGRSAIKKLVLANVCGKNLSQAHGLSIYFPEKRVHNSYAKAPFAMKNKWLSFIEAYADA